MYVICRTGNMLGAHIYLSKVTYEQFSIILDISLLCQFEIDVEMEVYDMFT